MEEILLDQIRTYRCLYEKSKMSYKECGVNINAWSKVVEKFDLIPNGICKCRFEKLAVRLYWQRIEELGKVFLLQKYTFWSMCHFLKWIFSLWSNFQNILPLTENVSNPKCWLLNLFLTHSTVPSQQKK